VRTTCVLEAVSGARAGERFRLSAGRTVIGRHPSCGIILDAVAVSRQHAAVGVEGDDAWIEDLGSRNGTVIDGRRISGRRTLLDADEIVIGEERLRFRSDAPLTAERVAGSGELAVGGVDEGDGGPGSMIVSAVDLPPAAGGAGGDHETIFRASLGLDRVIGASVALDEVLPRTLEGLFEIFPQAERGFVLLVDPDSRRLVVRASRFAASARVGPVLFSRSVMDLVVRSRQAVLSEDVSADSRFDLGGSVVDCGIRSVMCVPFVRADGGVLGVLQIDRGVGGADFQQADLGLLAGVAGRIARAIEQAMVHEERLSREQLRRDLELAHRVQQGLLPARPPEIRGYETFDFYEPARQISGDFFSYVPLADQRTAVVLADVSGKGVSAALVMAALSADVRYCLASEPDAARAVSRINESLCRSGWEDRFATLVVAVLDPRVHRLTVVNAGHMPPLLRDARGGVVPLGAEEAGLPLGVDPDHAYNAAHVPLEAGSTLVLYTDGVSEALDHAQRTYGIPRLERVIEAGPGAAAELGRCILADVERHAAGQVRSDDICLVCVGRTAAESAQIAAPEPAAAGVHSAP